MKYNVLVTDAQPRMTLAVIRSLGKKGVEVYAAEKTRFAPGLFSKYSHKALLSPDSAKSPEQYFSWLKETLQRESCSILFPMDDHTLEIVMDKRLELEQICHMGIPPVESYRIAADKAPTYHAATAAGIPSPPTLTDVPVDELETVADKIAFPVVIKPRKSSGSRGLSFVEEKSSLAKAYLDVHAVHPFPLIQQYIPPSAKYSVCLLFDRDSKLKASFVQRQVRHYPVDMGTSVVQESVYYPELVEMALQLMNRLPWYGVVELEFLIDKQGRPYFQEINPRFWGSVYMSILAGVDFPWLLYRLICGEEVEETFTYRTGLRCRWLLPGDILHFLTDNNRRQMNPPFLSGRKQGVYDDIISAEDPLPTAGFAMSCLRYLFDLRMWRFMLKK